MLKCKGLSPSPTPTPPPTITIRAYMSGRTLSNCLTGNNWRLMVKLSHLTFIFGFCGSEKCESFSLWDLIVTCDYTIAHFQITFSLFFKMSPGAYLFIWLKIEHKALFCQVIYIPFILINIWILFLLKWKHINNITIRQWLCIILKS